jgi:hypothetical protein
LNVSRFEVEEEEKVPFQEVKNDHFNVPEDKIQVTTATPGNDFSNKELEMYQRDQQLSLNADLQAIAIKDDVDVSSLIENIDFLCFIQIYFNRNIDHLDQIVHIYLAHSYDECIEVMEERNKKLEEDNYINF